MNEEYEPKAFWDGRFRMHGHTGDADSLLYAYDQPQRLRAIKKSLFRSNILISTDTRILDIGCGTGDLIDLFVKFANPEITGIDISDVTLSFTRERFGANPKVGLFSMGVEEMDFLSDSFDLAIGINVLQHIIGEEAFLKAVKNMVRVVRARGYLLVMDFSPAKVKVRRPAPYVIIRSRQEYLKAFEGNGCRFILEFGLPRIGVRIYRRINNVIAQLRWSRNSQKMTTETFLPKYGQGFSAKSRVAYIMRVILLKLLRHFDYWLAPFPSRYTDMRILVFEKVPR